MYLALISNRCESNELIEMKKKLKTIYGKASIVLEKKVP